MHEITDGLYLTNSDNVENKKLLRRNKIGAVLNVAAELNLEIPRYFSFKRFMDNLFNNKKGKKSIRGIFKGACEVEYRKVPLRDAQNPLESLQEAILTLEEMTAQHHQVALCCRAGRSRSPSIGVLYLCRNNDMTFREAYVHVAKNHFEFDVSKGMLESARKYYQQLLDA